MKLITLLALLFTLNIAADEAVKDFWDTNLDHLDRVEIGDGFGNEGVFTVNYPGLGDISNSIKSDCFLLDLGRGWVNQEKLEQLKNNIIILDGPGILFGNGSTRDINVLDPEIKRLRGGQGRATLVYHLKDLSTYVTGIKIKSNSPYITLSQSLAAILGPAAKDVELIFLRGCKL